MTSSSLVKRRKISMMDMISSLPDAILCHILSFLETKEAVATSILSKRWKHLWLSVPVMDLSNTRLTGPEANVCFHDFVYSVLLSRDSALPIKIFRLNVVSKNPRQNNLNMPSFAKWINFVLQRGGVEYLDLYVGCVSRWPILPITIFSCTTLVVLKLHYFKVVDHRFSSVLLLPSLKTLHLQVIKFAKCQDFMLLLAKCPILEDLLVSELWFDDKEDSLSCNNKWKNFSLSNLTKADVDYSYFQFPMKVLHNVQSLSLCIAKAHCFNDAIPTFHNLTCMHLESLRNRCHFLLQVFKHCPKLQELYVDEDGMNSHDQYWTRKLDKENFVEPDFVPQCLSLHLRVFYFSSVFGLQGELQLARYILKNARVLQTMRIATIGEPEIKELLSSFPRASSSCKLTFAHHVPCDSTEYDDSTDDYDSSSDANESSMDSNA